jgi:hypothetical protein
MRKVIGLAAIGLVWLAAIGVVALPVAVGSAAPLLRGQSLDESSHEASVVRKVHGFHCRRVFGWDPVAGVYQPHSHPGICHDHNRCLREQKRCMFVLGRGFQQWSYEAFGADNTRFSACMIRSGCY